MFSAAVGGWAIMAALQFSALARGVEALPKFDVQQKPINRATGGATSYAPVIKKAEPSVVNIYTTSTVHVRPMLNPFFSDPFFQHFFGGGGGQENQTLTRKEQSLGSGVIVSSDGYILTANHVVDGADRNGVKVTLAVGGNEYTAKIIGTDPATDVAVLKINANDLPAITIANSDQLQVGDVVLAIGNPFGVGQTVTLGIVSALGRTSLGISDYEDFIQTDAAINPGNSGGALVDAEGRLIGINTAILTRSGGYQGVGFAIPVNLACSVMDRLIKYGKVTRGYLGVALQPEMTSDLAQQFDLPDQRGAMVADVEPNSPAAKVGLRPGDVIREVDAKKVADRDQLRLMISQMQPGTKVTLKILRSEPGGKPLEKTMAVTLTELPENAAGLRSRVGPGEEKAPNQDSLDGVEVTDLTPNVRRQLSLPRDLQGALVTGVDENSSAAQAGLRQGDVILEINRQPVRNADDAVALSRKAKGAHVLLRLWREGTGSFYLSVENSKQP